MIGAVLSLFAISIMSYVLLKSLNEFFFTPLIERDTVLFQDKDMVSTIPVNFGLEFSNLPCALVSVDQEDLIGHHRLNIQDTVSKIPVDKTGKPNNNIFDGHKTEKLKEAIANQEGCTVKGFVPISKVQGDVHISFHAYRDIYSYLIENELSYKITMSHKFAHLNFGDEQISMKVLEKFQMTDQLSSFNRGDNLPQFLEQAYDKDFDYFTKIIPQVFFDEYTGEEIVAYQYSFTSKAKTREDKNHMPIIMMTYDYSPVAMKYTMKRRYFSHLVTNICALIGGVFVIFSIINSVMNRITETLEEDTSKNRKSIN
eukprot:CAMPEP_0170519974 /NCGR_PEP_ID=MMETSP0209-20121228/5186_1 /TAXON_ID=665100 ORGANISM="Litonotus pictus, Strain P1" /NCGR_SAMPLE_ID=MMETSP0209 /ASSEMBLY_ACC=CAM_ASM_000301 /LENGTH=312 /DNA_ID=CAMNT_0010805985 /DNA_START=56 /DNA_END=994 /DNA_ORIENTATION=-